MENRKTFAIVGLVLGIVTLVCSFIPYACFFAIATGIVGIILSAKGKKGLQAAGEKAALATVGLVLSIVGLVCAAIMSIVYACTLICVGAATAAYEADPDGFTSALGEALNSEIGNEIASAFS